MTGSQEGGGGGGGGNGSGGSAAETAAESPTNSASDGCSTSSSSTASVLGQHGVSVVRGLSGASHLKKLTRPLKSICESRLLTSRLPHIPIFGGGSCTNSEHQHSNQQQASTSPRTPPSAGGHQSLNPHQTVVIAPSLEVGNQSRSGGKQQQPPPPRPNHPPQLPPPPYPIFANPSSPLAWMGGATANTPHTPATPYGTNPQAIGWRFTQASHQQVAHNPAATPSRTQHFDDQKRALDFATRQVQLKAEKLEQTEKDVRHMSSWMANSLSVEEKIQLESGSQAILQRLSIDITSVQKELDALRRLHPNLVPPAVPSRPTHYASAQNGLIDAQWMCSVCSSPNNDLLYHCETCQKSRFKIDPGDAGWCRCRYCADVPPSPPQ